MHVVTLSAATPLTKTFVSRDGVITATPYPHVSKVTSHHHEVRTLQQLHAVLEEAAQKKHCLFGGQLNRPIENESRAGLTAKTDRHWLVFDFDRVEGSSPADVVKRYLPACCQTVSYIAQLSASMFRPDTTLWSGHIFMMLKEPISETRLKQWFESLNFSQPALEQMLSLSDSEQALHWPLDRTVAYNSKLIYIAAPRCHGFEPAIKEHIKLVKKKNPSLTIPSFQPIDSVTIRTKINALRRDIGLDDIEYTTTPFENAEVLRSSHVMDIHGIRTSGDHYIRFNLNGGDSYAYFIDLRAPELIRNFKGEPYLKTEDAAPDLWKSLRVVAPRVAAKQPLEDNTEVLAFYATNQNSQIKIGTFSPGSRNVTLHSSTETAAKAWLAEYGLVQKGLLPHISLVFNPHDEVQYVPGLTEINTFRPSDYMVKKASSAKASSIKDVPVVIDKWMRSILGDPTDEVYSHWLNWLAFCFQKREKPGTAWVLSGEEGTGKGSFVKYVLTPLFGADHVRSVQYGLLDGEFNDFLEKSLFVVFEEADLGSANNDAKLMAKLYHYITDSPLMIRRMRTDPYPAPNFTAFLFFSNKRTPVAINRGQRRFNIAERQEQRLWPTPNELQSIQTGAELDDFADMLLRWPLDEMQVNTTVETQASADVHEATTSINQLVAEAILDGDLQFFIDRMPSDAIANADFFGRFNPIGLFKTAIDEAINSAQLGEAMYLSDEHLFPLFRTLIPDPRFFQDSKTWRLRHYKALGLDVQKFHKHPLTKKTIRGLRVEWRLPDDVEPIAKPDNVRSIRSKKK